MRQVKRLILFIAITSGFHLPVAAGDLGPNDAPEIQAGGYFKLPFGGAAAAETTRPQFGLAVRRADISAPAVVDLRFGGDLQVTGFHMMGMDMLQAVDRLHARTRSSVFLSIGGWTGLGLGIAIGGTILLTDDDDDNPPPSNNSGGGLAVPAVGG